jgi:hypothetical protein
MRFEHEPRLPTVLESSYDAPAGGSPTERTRIVDRKRLKESAMPLKPFKNSKNFKETVEEGKRPKTANETKIGTLLRKNGVEKKRDVL